MVHLNGTSTNSARNNGYHKSELQQVLDLPSTIPDKLQPHDIEAEEAVIGSLLIDPDAILKVSSILDSGDFFIHRLGWIYGAMKAMFGRGIPANDRLLIADELTKTGKDLEELGGQAGLTDLTNRTPTSIHAEYYAGIVVEKAIRRRAIAIAGEIARLANNLEITHDELIVKSEKMLLEIGSDKAGEVESAYALTGQVVDHIERVYQARGQGIIGLPTGLTDWDKITGGLQNDELLVIGGRPGMGKSGLALQIARYTAKRFGRRWLYLSLEMSKIQLMQRLIGCEAGIDVNRLRVGNIYESEWPALSHAQEIVSKLPIYIYDNVALTPQSMRSIAIRHQARCGIDGIILDYLQLMDIDGKSRNRTQDVSDISRACKKLARELHVPVIALASLNRGLESRADKRPMLSDLRDSGAIESDADSVVFLYRDDVYNPDTQFPNITEIIIAKHRSAPTGIFSVYFKKHLIEFLDLEVRRQPLEYVS